MVTEQTAFGRVLGSIMEVRAIPAEPEEMRALAERSGLDGERFMARVASENARLFHLSDLPSAGGSGH